MTDAGGVFLNPRRRLARFDVRDQVMQQRAQRHAITQASILENIRVCQLLVG